MTIVAYHLVLKFLLSAIVRTIYKLCVGKTRVKLDLHTAWQKMAPAGIASGIDIGFSNWGLGLVPISLYTMTKSSTIVFILIFAIMLGLEKKVFCKFKNLNQINSIRLFNYRIVSSYLLSALLLQDFLCSPTNPQILIHSALYFCSWLL